MCRLKRYALVLSITRMLPAALYRSAHLGYFSLEPAVLAWAAPVAEHPLPCGCCHKSCWRRGRWGQPNRHKRILQQGCGLEQLQQQQRTRLIWWQGAELVEPCRENLPIQDSSYGIAPQDTHHQGVAQLRHLAHQHLHKESEAAAAQHH